MRTYERFRISISQDEYGWKGTLYDLADHGPDLPYAKVTGSLERVLDSLSHFALVAEPWTLRLVAISPESTPPNTTPEEENE